LTAGLDNTADKRPDSKKDHPGADCNSESTGSRTGKLPDVWRPVALVGHHPAVTSDVNGIAVLISENLAALT
jgi:hypothetical protein